MSMPTAYEVFTYSFVMTALVTFGTAIYAPLFRIDRVWEVLLHSTLTAGYLAWLMPFSATWKSLGVWITLLGLRFITQGAIRAMLDRSLPRFRYSDMSGALMKIGACIWVIGIVIQVFDVWTSS